MGAGGRVIDTQRTPPGKPAFTYKQLKNAIPPHCFSRSLLRSSSLLIRDLTLVYIFYYIATNYIDDVLPIPLSYVAWTVYVILQGCTLTALWVLAHECGHNAFSNYRWLDDTIGLVLHSALLVPYFSWKITHRRHHANTNSLDKEEVYIPPTVDTLKWYSKYLNTLPGRVIKVFTALTMGMPLYLIFNIYGKKYNKLVTSHFDPYSPIFSESERLQVFFSNAALLPVIYIIIHATLVKGLSWVAWVYGGPMLVLNALFMMVTFLNHTHSSLPYFDSSEFEWMRGALSTVDRDLGDVFNKVFHHMSSTHVAHHLFPHIPHYHATEATLAMKPILGKYYQSDPTLIFKAFWREVRECAYVERDEDDQQNKGVWWYTNKF